MSPSISPLSRFALVCCLLLAGCSKTTQMIAPSVGPGSPEIGAATDHMQVKNPVALSFTPGSSNPYFPLVVGTAFNYRSKTKDGIETETFVVTSDTKGIQGVTTRVIQDDVWLDPPPALGPFNRCGRILWIAFGGSGVSPLHENVDITLFQRTIVCEMSIVWISRPRRHFPRRDSSLDRFCPRTRFLISKERHWGNLSRAMTVLTVLLQDGKYVLRKSYRGRLFGRYSRHR